MKHRGSVFHGLAIVAHLLVIPTCYINLCSKGGNGIIYLQHMSIFDALVRLCIYVKI